jgi:hypothetical protein
LNKIYFSNCDRIDIFHNRTLSRNKNLAMITIREGSSFSYYPTDPPKVEEVAVNVLNSFNLPSCFHSISILSGSIFRNKIKKLNNSLYKIAETKSGEGKCCRFKA